MLIIRVMILDGHTKRLSWSFALKLHRIQAQIRQFFNERNLPAALLAQVKVPSDQMVGLIDVNKVLEGGASQISLSSC